MMRGLFPYKLIFGVLVVTFVTACSFPGLRIDDYGDTSPWYKQDTSWYVEKDPRYAGKADQFGEDQPSYNPEYHKITPGLIVDMRQQATNSKPAELDRPHARDSYDYLVGPGDILQVVVFGNVELTNPGGRSGGGTDSGSSAGRVVRADGSLYFPYVGRFQAAGKSVDEIRQILTEGLQKVIRQPQVDVLITNFRSKRAYVVGDVSQPCAIPITDIGVSILDALDMCSANVEGGGPTRKLQLIRGENAYTIDLGELYRSVNPDLRLKEGDRLLVSQKFNRVFVLGEVGGQTTAAIPPGGLSLADALASAGGVSLSTADRAGIYVIRGFVDSRSTETGKLVAGLNTRIFHLNAESVDALLLADQFELNTRDVVFVAPADTVNVNRALGQIAPSLSLLIQSYFLASGDRGGR